MALLVSFRMSIGKAIECFGTNLSATAERWLILQKFHLLTMEVLSLSFYEPSVETVFG
jgi:hypothetical protein